MIPWEHLDSAPIPGESGTLRLLRRGSEFSIQLDRNELMNSRLSGSEEALARLAAERIAGVAAPRLLIGGYGMGFTLRAALGSLPETAQVSVAEIVPAVIAWARGPMAALTQGCLDDPRVTLRGADVAAVIAERTGAYDAILLDVDNGPDGLTRTANDRLYDAAGLATARAALRPRGVLAVWSAHPDAAFTRRLGQAGFSVEAVATRARGQRGARHVIWLAGKR
ncbi:spermidine synthase [Methylobacterium sp. Leaf118]|uniref:spermidine synthase n=1 Tax=Methylobacterium sp. Leaf118 TaxID=2876562 RepID=UPI001E58D067|nr:spermidine synthase [Methylobacterium sp. Leaf118]